MTGANKKFFTQLEAFFTFFSETGDLDRRGESRLGEEDLCGEHGEPPRLRWSLLWDLDTVRCIRGSLPRDLSRDVLADLSHGDLSAERS